MPIIWDCIWWYHICVKLNYFPWSRVGVHYRAEKKYQECLGKLYFKGHLQAESFLVELIFISRSRLSQGDGWITCELDYMLLF